MKKTLFDLYQILTKKEKIKFINLFFFMIVCSFLEILGISAIIPLISIVLKNNYLIFKDFFFYDQILELSSKDFFVLYCFIFIGLIFAIKNFFLIFYNKYSVKFYTNVANSVSNKLYFFYINLPYKTIIKQKSSSLIFNCINGVEHFKNCLSHFCILLQEIVIMTSILIFLLFLNFASTVLIFSFFILFGLFFYFFFIKKSKFWGEATRNSSLKRLDIITQTFFSIRDIKIYSAEKYFSNKFFNQNLQYKIFSAKNLFLITFPKIFFELIIILSILYILYIFFVKFKIDADLILINLAIYSISMFKLYPSVYRVMNSLQQINYGASLLKDLIEIFRNAFKKSNIKKYKSTDQNLNNDIKVKNSFSLKNISYKFNNKRDYLFKNINFKVNKGEFIGLKGDSGTGKSTLLDIIAGLINPTDGKYNIDGKLYSNLGLTWLQNNISYVSQNVSILDNSLLMNVALGQDERLVNKKKITDILKVVALKKYIKKNSSFLNIKESEKGLKISGGEKQRIGIARSLYFERNFYIFDEATNAVDEATEKTILKNLKKYLNKKFVIIVSHSDKTLDHCDFVYELKDGSLVKLR